MVTLRDGKKWCLFIYKATSRSFYKIEVKHYVKVGRNHWFSGYTVSTVHWNLLYLHSANYFHQSAQQDLCFKTLSLSTCFSLFLLLTFNTQKCQDKPKHLCWSKEETWVNIYKCTTHSCAENRFSVYPSGFLTG